MKTVPSLGFIGGGRVTTVLLGGLAHAGRLPDTVVVSDPDQAALERLRQAHPGIQTTQDNSEAAGQEIVFLAVHPPLAPQVLSETASAFQTARLVLSLLPKFTLQKLAALSDGFSRFGRMIPNAPSIIGKGYNPIVFDADVPPETRSTIHELCAAWGDAPEVAEPSLEAYAILTAMGPTYFWPQLYALVQLGEQFGLARDEALLGVQKMLVGAAATMSEAGLSAEQVQDLIPLKPLHDDLPPLLDAYCTKLAALLHKISP